MRMRLNKNPLSVRLLLVILKLASDSAPSRASF